MEWPCYRVRISSRTLQYYVYESLQLLRNLMKSTRKKIPAAEKNYRRSRLRLKRLSNNRSSFSYAMSIRTTV